MFGEWSLRRALALGERARVTQCPSLIQGTFRPVVLGGSCTGATPFLVHFCDTTVFRPCLEARWPHYFQGRPRNVLMNIKPSFISFMEGKVFTSYVPMLTVGLCTMEGLLSERSQLFKPQGLTFYWGPFHVWIPLFNDRLSWGLFKESLLVRNI